MLNIVRSDLFKIRKGKALYGVLLGTLVLLILVAGVWRYFQSSSYKENVAAQQQDQEVSGIELEGVEELLPSNGGEFLTMMHEEMGMVLLFFLLPFIIAVFGGDYAAGTYRNLLSYHSERGKIYMAKLITSAILTIVMLLSFSLFSMAIGGIVFGLDGFTSAVVFGAVKALLLMFPVLLALLSVGHCIMALTKKISATIAIYLVGLSFSGLIMQVPAMLFPKLEWVTELDLTGSITTVAQYAMDSKVKIMVPMVFSLILIVGTYIFGTIRYKTTDFDFN